LSATLTPPQHQSRHAREVDLGHEVRLFVVSGGELSLLGFRAGGAALDASVVVDREQLAEYRDALNAVLVATDPA
jgi:hypothetical protein